MRRDMHSNNNSLHEFTRPNHSTLRIFLSRSSCCTVLLWSAENLLNVPKFVVFKFSTEINNNKHDRNEIKCIRNMRIIDHDSETAGTTATTLGNMASCPLAAPLRIHTKRYACWIFISHPAFCDMPPQFLNEHFVLFLSSPIVFVYSPGVSGRALFFHFSVVDVYNSMHGVCEMASG